jgi:hypothetical protein
MAAVGRPFWQDVFGVGWCNCDGLSARDWNYINVILSSIVGIEGDIFAVGGKAR